MIIVDTIDENNKLVNVIAHHTTTTVAHNIETSKKIMTLKEDNIINYTSTTSQTIVLKRKFTINSLVQIMS